MTTLIDFDGLPAVFAALLSVFFVVATPVTNTITRTLEAQADIFGLNAARQPDGFATATLHAEKISLVGATVINQGRRRRGGNWWRS